MAVYFITGKLGSGKTLVSVGKIRDALQEGRKVATNLDIRLEQLVGKKAKKATVYRLPDKPVAEDMFALGSGNDTYDEEKNGLIVLDECGTWFNSRDWQDKTRKALIDWLLHARKLGWDILFIIQDVSMIDKQARKSICEHVVYCRRLDRIAIPFLDMVAKLVRKKGIPKPKVHMAIVKYGDLPQSLTVDRWIYTGRDLYRAYDTKQAFIADYPHKLHQVLPPYYSHGRYAVPWTGRNIMRMTKIYLRRFSHVALLAFGLGAGSFAGAYLQDDATPVSAAEDRQPGQQTNDQLQDVAVLEPMPDNQDVEKPETIAEKFDGYILQGVAQGPDGTVIFAQIANGEGDIQNVETLRSRGYVVKMVNKCEMLVMNRERTETARFYTSYCSPENPPQSPPTMSKSEQYEVWRDNVRADQRAVWAATDNVNRAQR